MIEIRASQLADVSFPKRMIELIVMPYATETQGAVKGKMVGEIVSRGAFDGIEKRAGQIRANRDHSWERPVGKHIGLHTSRKEGLVADIRISGTPLGEETLTLCDDGLLDASAGFKLVRRPDGDVW